MATIAMKQRFYCQHCDDHVSRSTYRRHQQEQKRMKRMMADSDSTDRSDEVVQFMISIYIYIISEQE